MQTKTKVILGILGVSAIAKITYDLCKTVRAVDEFDIPEDDDEDYDCTDEEFDLFVNEEPNDSDDEPIAPKDLEALFNSFEPKNSAVNHSCEDSVTHSFGCFGCPNTYSYGGTSYDDNNF